MQVLLRKVTEDELGQIEYLDTSLDGEELTIGSSPQCDIQLLGMSIAALHAHLLLDNDQIKIQATKKNYFVVNTKKCRTAQLNVGDEFAVDAQAFKVVAPPTGFDLALEWYFKPVAGHLLENAYRTSPENLRFSVRKASWLLVLAVVVFAGLAPVADNTWRRWSNHPPPTNRVENAISDSFIPEQALQGETLKQGSGGEQEAGPSLVTAALGRPAADHFWLSGPMLPAHQIALGDRCESCHEKPFQRVQDNACKSCHSVDDHLNIRHPAMADFTQFSCQSCHKEHNEQQQIVSNSDLLCVQCHGSNTQVEVREFSSSGHPPFAATLLQPSSSNNATPWNEVSWTKVKASTNTELREQNHLIFPHDEHLDPNAVTHLQRGDGLVCADCHSLTQGGEHFAPINMRQHCADCHDLSFDRDNPQKQLPHGEPTEVFEVLKNYYVDLAFNPRQSEFERRRLPGKVHIDERCIEDYSCALQQTQQQAQQQFTQSGCVTCHAVSVLDNAEGGDQWQVLPVKLNDDWYPSSRFDHRSHLTPTSHQQSAQTGIQQNNAVCLSCHRADVSANSSDALMPSREQCTNCHGDGGDAGFLFKPRVALNCISCHDYHSAIQLTSKEQTLEPISESTEELARESANEPQ